MKKISFILMAVIFLLALVRGNKGNLNFGYSWYCNGNQPKQQCNRHHGGRKGGKTPNTIKRVTIDQAKCMGDKGFCRRF